jgi:hypothetical protein
MRTRKHPPATAGRAIGAAAVDDDHFAVDRARTQRAQERANLGGLVQDRHDDRHAEHWRWFLVSWGSVPQSVPQDGGLPQVLLSAQRGGGQHRINLHDTLQVEAPACHWRPCAAA